MVARRKDGTARSAADRRAAGAWRELAPAGGLLGTVLGILVITAVLQGDAEDPAPRPGGTDPVPPATLVQPSEIGEPAPKSTSVPAPPAEDERQPRIAPTAGTLEVRARHDYERMFRNPGHWTLQLMVGCDPDNVRKHVMRFSDEPDLFVLPMDHKGQSCYRICWGMYGSRDAALAAPDIPAALRAEIGHPEPREIAAVTP